MEQLTTGRISLRRTGTYAGAPVAGFVTALHTSIRFGHPSGSLRVGAEAHQANGQWIITKAVMSRSARVLMDGHVHVPADSF